MSNELIVEYGIYLIVIGLVLVLLLCLMLFLRRRGQSKKQLRPAAAAVADDTKALPELPTFGEADTMSGSDEGADGFQIFKKKKSQNKDSKSDDLVSQLQNIEQEMLALRELFRNGEITRSVYIAETKALYEKAQQVKTV